MIHFSIILPFTPVYSSGFFTAVFRTKYLRVFLSPIKYVHIVISAVLSFWNCLLLYLRHLYYGQADKRTWKKYSYYDWKVIFVHKTVRSSRQMQCGYA